MGAPLWPFPGQAAAELFGPVQPLAPARFAVGDRVCTRWGRGAIIAVQEHAWEGYRAYCVKHTWSTAPEGFGHFFGEDEIELAGPEPAALEDEAPEPAAAAPAQGELF